MVVVIGGLTKLLKKIDDTDNKHFMFPVKCFDAVGWAA